MIFAVLEGICLSFVLLMICVVNIRNGAVGGVIYYEKPVKMRVIQMGLTSEKEIKRTRMLSSIPFFVSVFVVCPLLVYFANGAEGFLEGFIQLTVCYLICGLFDRIFIDWYWVGHTKAWLIPGTEDLMPYIPKEAWIKKLVGTFVGYPLVAALMAFLYSRF